MIPLSGSILLELIRHPEKPLALIGGVAVGAYFLQRLASFMLRRLTRKPMPGWSGKTLNILGGGAGGYLVYLMLFGGGGGGIGGPGGTSTGVQNSTPAPSSSPPETITETQILRPVVIKVRVLTDPGSKDLAKDLYDPRKHYLITTPLAELITFEALLERLKNAQQPPTKLDRIHVLLGKDDPDKDTPRVRMIRQWAQSMQIPIEFLPLESE